MWNVFVGTFPLFVLLFSLHSYFYNSLLSSLFVCLKPLNGKEAGIPLRYKWRSLKRKLPFLRGCAAPQSQVRRVPTNVGSDTAKQNEFHLFSHSPGKTKKQNNNNNNILRPLWQQTFFLLQGRTAPGAKRPSGSQLDSKNHSGNYSVCRRPFLCWGIQKHI